MPQFLTDLQDRRTLKNLDNLELVGCSLSKEIKEEIKELNGRVDISSKNVGDIVKSIETREKMLRKTDNEIKTMKNEMNELSDKIGAKKYVNQEYRKLKKYVKTLKEIKKEYVRTMSQLYAQLQEEKRKLKDTSIKQKSLYKTTKDLAKEREKEISFARKIELGKMKIENKDAAQKILDQIKQNNGKLPKDIQADGAQLTMEDAFNVLNGHKTINEVKKMDNQEQGKEENTDEARNESEESELNEDKDKKETEEEPAEEYDPADYYQNGEFEQQRQEVKEFLLEDPNVSAITFNEKFGTRFNQGNLQKGILEKYGIDYNELKKLSRKQKEIEEAKKAEQEEQEEKEKQEKQEEQEEQEEDPTVDYYGGGYEERDEDDDGR